jgi:CHAT domain-containing protein/tetratricopeptide (TPR) repeat protein
MRRLGIRPIIRAALVVAVTAPCVGRASCADMPARQERGEPARTTGQNRDQESILRQRQALADQAGALKQEAIQLYNQGDPEAAFRKAEQALSLYQRALPEAEYPRGHDVIATTWGLLGAMRAQQRRYEDAVPYADRALAMLDRLHPPGAPGKSPYIDRTLDFVALVHYEVGTKSVAREEFGDAVVHFSAALRAQDRRYPAGSKPEDITMLRQTLNNLAASHLMRGEHHLAASFVKRELALIEASSPQPSRELARCLNNLGSLLRDMGDYEEAREYLVRARTLFEKLPNVEPAEAALNLNNLAILENALGDSQAAVEHLHRAAGLFERAYPDGHRDRVGCLSTLSSVLGKQGQSAEALDLARKALELGQRMSPPREFPKGSLLVAGLLLNYGTHLMEQGDYQAADAPLRDSVAMFERLRPKADYPLGHPNVAMARYHRAALDFYRGRHAEAFDELKQASSMYHDLADAFYDGASEAEAMSFAAHFPRACDLLLSVALHVPKQAADEQYEMMWRSKAAVTRFIERRQNALSGSASSELKRLWQQLGEARAELSHLAFAPMESGSPEARRQRLRALGRRKEELESELARALPDFARRRELESRPHTDLVAHLPANLAFIDLLRYDQFTRDVGDGGMKRRLAIPHYVAFVLRRGRPVVRVELGQAEAIETCVSGWRVDIAARRDGDRAAELRRLVWVPLERYLDGAGTVVLSPDDQLTMIPWAALPGARPDTVLLQDYALASVPHGPALLDRVTRTFERDDGVGVFLAVGGADYDAPGSVLPEGYRSSPAAVRGGRIWAPLPGAAGEVEDVAAIAGRRSVRTLRGAEADLARVLTELPRARWAHLATHGFFAADQVRSALQAAPARISTATPGGAAPLASGRNPLLLSGLVLAGANRSAEPDTRHSPGATAGILTAEAIASLALGHVRMVVLSACETGLGKVAGGEGVFGLQRAFHQGGAERVVASLWKVDDDATRALMIEFYRNLWGKGLGTAEALRQAQLTMRSRFDPVARKLRGLEPLDVPTGKRGPSVFDWAAFVLSGDWR